jgi:hypothetical protein
MCSEEESEMMCTLGADFRSWIFKKMCPLLMWGQAGVKGEGVLHSYWLNHLNAAICDHTS